MPDFDQGHSAVASSAGEATITVRPRSSIGMVVKQVAVETPGANQGSCTIRKNDWLISPVVPGADAAAGDPPIHLGPTDELRVVFVGQQSGQTCRATVFWWEP